MAKGKGIMGLQEEDFEVGAVSRATLFFFFKTRTTYFIFNFIVCLPFYIKHSGVG
jgi:hypothetical protein